MIYKNITLADDVDIDPSSSFNNVSIGSATKIAKNCSIFGNPDYPVIIGESCYFGMNSILEGYNAQVKIGKFVSFAQNVNLMTGSGPNASNKLQNIFPVIKGPVTIDDHCWIGASAVIMPNVHLGEFCVVAANSYVNTSFPKYSIIGGSPAKLIRTLTEEEIKKIEQ